MGSSFVDDVECGNFFDHIDDLIEFPPEDECGRGLVSSDDCKDFPSMWNEAIGDNNPLFPGCNINSAYLSAELAVPVYEDIIPLEWLSTFVEDSFSCGGMILAKDNSCVNEETSQNQFLTSSPVSVLESSSSSSSSNSEIKVIPVMTNQCGAQRARSKRPRPAIFSPRPAINSSFNDTHPLPVSGVPSEPESIRNSKHARTWHEPHMPEQKKKKIKPKVPLSPTEANQQTPPQSVRKCQHCEITKTPQWRAGPMGPKTLCNACGVRFKSGRLFPEYRPAASPTFVPTLHSSSHKKVVEMRNKLVEKNPLEDAAGSVSISSQGDMGPVSKLSA